jgi:outer membrane protein assembly factor BamA
MPALLQKQSRQAVNRIRLCRGRCLQSTIWYSFCNMRQPIFLLLTLLTIVSAASPAPAQKFEFKNIVFKGDPEYSDQELMAGAGLKKGVPLTALEMNDHAKTLLDSGMFAGVSYKFDGSDMIFSLTPTPPDQLYPIRLENLPLINGPELDAKLRERFPLYHGKVGPDSGMLESVRTTLEEMLATKGIKATVTAMPYTDQKQHKVAAISFNIDSPPVQVGEIHLDPASPALDAKAQEILTRQSGSPYNVEGSPAQIVTYLGNYYHDKGYLEADIHAAPQGAPLVTTDAIHIPFLLSLTPGSLYKLSSVQLAPGVLVTQAEFDHQSHIHPGDIADGQHVRENWQFITRQYHNKGYMKSVLKATPTFDRAQNTVTFLVNVDTGPLYNMGTLRIDNVSDDLRTAMLAAWKMPAGSPFNESAILGFYAIGQANPALKRVFAAVEYKYNLTLNDDTHTIDVVLRLDKRK